MLARIDSNGTVYYTQDGNQNVTAITGVTGAVKERYTYDVFGTPTIANAAGVTITTSAVGNRFLFTGREYISQIGLYDYRNRVYSPGLGRFLQTDPLRFEAGDINVYRYVGNGPVNGTDPMGLCKPFDPLGLAAGLLGLGSAFGKGIAAELAGSVAASADLLGAGLLGDVTAAVGLGADSLGIGLAGAGATIGGYAAAPIVGAIASGVAAGTAIGTIPLPSSLGGGNVQGWANRTADHWINGN